MAEHMSPAEYYAALLALDAGLKAEIGKAKAAVLDAADQAGAERFRTPYGPVTVATRKPRIEIEDEAAFLEWVREHRPDEIVTTEAVRDSYRTSVLTDRLTTIRGEVFDSKTGEPVDWAGLTPEGAPYATWTASAEQKATKQHARDLFADRAGDLTVGLRALTTGED